MASTPYRAVGRPPDIEEDVQENHVTNAADSIQGPRDQPSPWWSTKEWRGSHVRLTFRRPAKKRSCTTSGALLPSSCDETLALRTKNTLASR